MNANRLASAAAMFGLRPCHLRNAPSDLQGFQRDLRLERGRVLVAFRRL